jgi:hypothetical protein
MNTHLLRTRLVSIAHYTEEIKKLEAARKTTEETRKEIVESLREFFPFMPGQILINGQQVRKFKGLDGVRLSFHDNPVFSVFLQRPMYDGFEPSHEQKDWNFETIAQWKVISTPENVEP